MIYADYDYYFFGPYHGALSMEEFGKLVIRASSFLNYITQGKAEQNAELDAVKMCCCALVDQYAIIEAAQELAKKNIAAGLASDGAEVQSETVGGYSRSLRSGGDSSSAAIKAASAARRGLAGVAREYLSHTGMLYRGRCFECTPPTL